MSEALGITAFYIFIAAIIVAAVLYLEQRLVAPGFIYFPAQ
ncbi:small membrane protein YldA [Escherichia coli]|nr:small membrane protein YldA [Escherichia coli]MDM4885845.1 small membrane protein YldA [Escherichia coli]